MESHALTGNCAKNFDRREHCCFGISPFNSYFSEDRIRELARWGMQEFRTLHFFVPDVPSVYTLEAQGYPREKAEWKARRQSQYLKNKIHRALISLSISNEAAKEMVLDWERLAANSRYRSLHDEVSQLFELDADFRAHCLEASRWVMTQKVDSEENLTEEALLLAVRYFLSEIPLFADTAGIVNQNSSVFCYHQRVGFLERFYEKKLSYSPQANQGFLIVKPKEPNLEFLDHPVLPERSATSEC